MKHSRITLVLAAILTLLSACGEGTPQETAPVTPPVSVETTQTPETAPPETAAPGTSAPETKPPVETEAVGSWDSGTLQVTLSQTDVTLNRKGQTFTLRAEAEGTPENTRPALVWSSSDESVATVTDNNDGTALVTAVGTGTAAITASGIYSTFAVENPLELSCIVRCRWTEETSAPALETDKPGETVPPAETAPAAALSVDLAAFYQTVTDNYEFGFLELADQTLLDNYYPGLSDIDTEQCLVYICMMSLNNGEFALVQVKNSDDVPAVKEILQARVDGMADGGAWYPAAMEQWTNNSRVVSNGNYVMMVVHESADSIVSAFNEQVK